VARWFLACGIVGPVLFVVTFLILGATRPNYDPVYTFVSQLSLDGGGQWQVANFLASGLLIVVAAVGLALTPAAVGMARWGWFGVALVGLGFVLLGVFSDDPWLSYPPGAPAGIGMPRSGTGWGHLLSAFGTFVALEAGAWSFVRGLGAAGMTRARAACLGLALAFPIFYAVALVSGVASADPTNPLGGYAGLFQRLSLAAAVTWVAWLAILFLRPPAPPSP
jgi:hypothetical protein